MFVDVYQHRTPCVDFAHVVGKREVAPGRIHLIRPRERIIHPVATGLHVQIKSVQHIHGGCTHVERVRSAGELDRLLAGITVQAAQGTDLHTRGKVSVVAHVLTRAEVIGQGVPRVRVQRDVVGLERVGQLLFGRGAHAVAGIEPVHVLLGSDRTAEDGIERVHIGGVPVRRTGLQVHVALDQVGE